MKTTTKLIILVLILLPQITHAAASTVLGRVREGYFLIAGYPSSITSNGPPQDGLISLVDYFSTQMQAIALTNGIASCTAVPSTGSVSGTFTVSSALTPFLGSSETTSISFETPLVNAPVGWNGAGSKFAKRVKVTKTGGVALAMEFNCGTNEFFATFALPGDNIGNSIRDINLYVKKNGVAVFADFFMTVTVSSRATVVDAQAVRLETTDGVTYNVWNTGVTMRDASYTCGGSACSPQFGYERSVIQGNSVTKIASIYAKFDKPDLTGAGTVAARRALVTSSSVATTAVGSFDFSQTEPNQGASIEKSGCVNLSSYADPTSGAYCSGALAAASSTPLIDPSGTFTVDWVKTSLLGKMLFAN